MLKHKFILLAMLVATAAMGQGGNSAGDGTTNTKPAKKFVKSTFENGVLINNQTVESTPKNGLEFMIQHRFGLLESADDLFGIFGPSNIRLGLTYGITKRLSVGIGGTKNKKLYGLDWKYAILKQQQGGGMPVSISYYGNVDRSANAKNYFQVHDDSRHDKDTTRYEASDRFSFYNEIMIARKFSKSISVQLAASYSHANLVDSGMKHDVLGVSFAGRYKFSPQSSIVIEFDYPVTVHDVNKNMPNLGIGYEVATSGHAFQIFICTADGINNQEIMIFNQNDFSKKKVLLGFNITRLWGF